MRFKRHIELFTITGGFMPGFVLVPEGLSSSRRKMQCDVSPSIWATAGVKELVCEIVFASLYQSRSLCTSNITTHFVSALF